MSSFKTKSASYGSIFLIFLTFFVPCISGYVTWIYPGPENRNLTFNYKDTVYFTWTSSIDGPWMNLWCAPSHTEPQSTTYVYHQQVSTNGTNPQSFDYSEYDEEGICHMQLENFEEDDFANTPTFDLTSDDAVEPQTWGLSALTSLGGEATPNASTSSSTITALTSSTSFSPTSSHVLASSSIDASPQKPPSTTPISVTPSIPSPPSPSTTTTSATPPQIPSQSSPSRPLSTAAKAGISIGSIFSALALIIAILLARIASSRRKAAAGRKQASNGVLGQYELRKVTEVGDGAFYELNGVGRPNELHSMPIAELEQASRNELDVIPGR